MYVFVMVVVCIAVITILLHNPSVTRFNRRFSPIDDHEFLRRCGADVDPDVALRVRRIVSDSLGVEYERIHPDQSFVEDLDCC